MTIPRDVPLLVHVARRARERIAAMPDEERREIEEALVAARKKADRRRKRA